MFAWSQLDFSTIPVSISAVSLTGRQTWQNVNSKTAKNSKCTGRARHQKKETSSCFFLSSFCFWGEVSNSCILNDIGIDRNFLLGSRKKIAKCLMSTFTCRSIFLYDIRALPPTPIPTPTPELHNRRNRHAA
jgi:hypothetical protein